jgi:hypothetical protein
METQMILEVLAKLIDKIDTSHAELKANQEDLLARLEAKVAVAGLK